MKKISLLLAIILLTGCTQVKQTVIDVSQPLSNNQSINQPIEPAKNTQTVHFAKYNPLFRFQANFPKDWQIEYIPEISSINIYNPQVEKSSIREKSQIFIRYFEANSFLTLTTVDILNRSETTLKNHPAVRYEIRKKDAAANFPSQPSWRNQGHKLIDVRLTNNNPSLFYVFSYNPNLEPSIFTDFIDSILFDNDPNAWAMPLDQAKTRVTKKPFGLKVSPNNSPVTPEIFSGYHTGIDFEILAGEEDALVPVNTICGGELLQTKTASGYGGVIVQSCLLNDQEVTVVYGHIKLNSITKKIGDYLAPGELLTYLGDGYSEETDNERKHLHLSIHLGKQVNLSGYVQQERDLNNWLDYGNYLK